jgi:hypothetical protein
LKTKHRVQNKRTLKLKPNPVRVIAHITAKTRWEVSRIAHLAHEVKIATIAPAAPITTLEVLPSLEMRSANDMIISPQQIIKWLKGTT